MCAGPAVIWSEDSTYGYHSITLPGNRLSMVSTCYESAHCVNGFKLLFFFQEKQVGCAILQHDLVKGRKTWSECTKFILFLLLEAKL